MGLSALQQDKLNLNLKHEFHFATTYEQLFFVFFICIISGIKSLIRIFSIHRKALVGLGCFPHSL